MVGAGRTRSPAGPVPTADTLFEIGSVTKVFTSLLLAIACLREEVSLETPLHELLTEGQVPSKDGHPITLRHLAHHTSGLPRLPMPWGEVARLELTRHPDPYATVSEAGALAAAERARLRRRPGEGRMHYSNLGVGLLGNALVRVAGAASYDELVRSRVCRPLGMLDTVVARDPEQRSRTAGGHRGRRPVANWTFPGLAGAGALWSTATDLLTFTRTQQQPDEHPLTEAFRMTHRDHGVAGTTLGWMTAKLGERRLLWHNGGTGGFRAFVGFVPGARDAVVVLANSSRSVDRTALTLVHRPRRT